MTTSPRSFGVTLVPTRISRAVCGAFLAGAALAFSTQTLSAQVTVSDDFNDGNDLGWERYDALAPVGKNATYSFPNGGYRIQTTYLGGSAQLTGRSGSVLPRNYTDFYIAVDVVNWNDTVPQSFGLLARIGTPGLGSTTGYAFTWDRGNTNSQTSGDVDISRLDNEAPTGITVTGSDAIRFQPGRTYRMVFIGKGAALEGRVFELPDTTTPVVVVQGTDPSGTPHLSGKNGVVVFDNSSGQNQTDATFDNFFATDAEPPRLQFVHNTFFELDLTWPASATGFVLQSSAVLPGTSADWTEVSRDLIRLQDGTFIYSTVTHPALGGEPQRFYRLVRP